MPRGLRKSLSIAAAQINPVVGDIAGNIARILRARNEVQDTGLQDTGLQDTGLQNTGLQNTDLQNIDLVVFSELALCGYIPEDLLYNANFLAACEQGIASLQRELMNVGGASILFGAPRLGQDCVRKDGFSKNSSGHARKLYNSAFLIDSTADGALAYCDKVCLPNYGVFDEKRYFHEAESCAPLPFRGLQLGVMLCEDFWDSEVAAMLAKRGADLLLVLNASPFERGKAAHRISTARGLVATTGLPLLYVNQIGGQDELLFDGGSFALSQGNEAMGNEPIGMAFFEEQTKVFRYQDKKIMLAGEAMEEAEFTKSCCEPEVSDALVYRGIEMGIRDYVRKNEISRVVIGISGGIDSALCATLACDALGAGCVDGLFMPSPYTSVESREDAFALAERLGFRLRELPIDDAMCVVAQIFRSGVGEVYDGIASENVQARLRALLLMAFANHRCGMLLATGNKSEYATGYTTLYGDMCGGYAPLKDLYKTEVFALSRWRNRGIGLRVANAIAERILTKPPSAELRLHQRDDDSLPPYDILDPILRYLLEGDVVSRTQRKILQDSTSLKHIRGLLHASEHKRWQAPPGPKLGLRAFGRDRRYSISNHFLETNCDDE